MLTDPMTAKQYLELQAKVYESTKCPDPIHLSCKVCRHREIYSRVAHNMLKDDDYPADSFIKTFELHATNTMYMVEIELGEEFILFQEGHGT